MRFLISIAVVLLVTIVAYSLTRPSSVPVDVAVAELGEIREFVEEQAKTRLPDVVQITMPMQGRILPITLREGDPIQKDEIVARLDPADLETDLVEQTNTVKRYDKNLEQIDLTVQQAAQTVMASQAKYDFAEKMFSRTKALVDGKSASIARLEQDELQMTEAALELRREQLNQNIYQLMRGVVELMRESDVARRAKIIRDQDRTVIRSPVGGVVLSKHVSNETVLTPGTVLLEVGDPELLEIEAEVLTQDVAQVRVGDRVEIEGSAVGDQPAKGIVSRIYPQGFTKISSLGVEQQRVKVIVQFGDGERERLAANGRSLGVDYRVRIRILTDEANDVVTVPRAAIFRGPKGEWQAFVLDEGRAKLVDLQIGLQNDFKVQVISGLPAGKQVVLAPDSDLADGLRVRINGG